MERLDVPCRAFASNAGVIHVILLTMLFAPWMLLARGVQAQSDVTLTVSAASDLTPAFEQIGPLFEQETGIAVDFNFGSTGQLTEQIKAGAPVDVFAAASVSYIDALEKEGLIFPDTKALYARGRIVLWVRDGLDMPVTELQALRDTGIQRIAIANPEHAPYGVAAREALQTAGVWDAIQSRLVLGENVSDTLRLAETGNVDVAIVALSLAIKSEGEWTLISEELHAPLDQALAVIKGTKHEAEARAFAGFINSDPARRIMNAYGFMLPGEFVPVATPAASPPAGAGA